MVEYGRKSERFVSIKNRNKTNLKQDEEELEKFAEEIDKFVDETFPPNNISSMNIISNL